MLYLKALFCIVANNMYLDTQKEQILKHIEFLRESGKNQKIKVRTNGMTHALLSTRDPWPVI